MTDQLTGEQQIRLASINISSDFSRDILSLFALAVAIEGYIADGSLPDIEDDDDDGDEGEGDETTDLMPSDDGVPSRLN